MIAKYVITEIDNGWILSDDDGDHYFETFNKLVDAMRNKEMMSKQGEQNG